MTSVLFTIAGRRVGSGVVNRLRLIFAVILLIVTHVIMEGVFFPFNASLERWFWLGLSGVLGLVIGDGFLFQAFIVLGPRLSMLMMAFVPVLSTMMAWAFLGERLRSMDLVAIIISVIGISWVVLEREGRRLDGEAKPFFLGVLYGFGGAIGQALGLITAKQGLVGDFSQLSAVLLRMSVAMVVIWILALIQGKVKESISAIGDRHALKAIVGASVVGPFLGVWLSLIAIDLAPVGIASTLMALTPIFLIPVVRWVFKETVTSRSIYGTIVAMFGVAMIFLS
jgi:drug/metabolite transporter (DMT)-like permease